MTIFNKNRWQLLAGIIQESNHFSVQEILDSRECLEEDEPTNVFFHATPVRNLEQIMQDGLKPGSGDTFNTGEWSKGKVFLSQSWPQAIQWQGMIAEELGEDVAIIEATLTTEQMNQLSSDTVSQDEGDMCSFYLTTTIAPSQLDVVDDGYGTGSF